MKIFTCPECANQDRFIVYQGSDTVRCGKCLRLFRMEENPDTDIADEVLDTDSILDAKGYDNRPSTGGGPDDQEA